MKVLTEKQKAILDFIEDFLEKESMAPTVYEIAEHFQIKTSTVFAHLRALQRKKQLSRSSKARSITLTKMKHQPRFFNGFFAIPLLGRINAGCPAESIENAEGEIPISEAMLGGVAADQVFALRIQGESMRDLGIYDGDIVVVARNSELRPGDIVAAMIDPGEVTIKSFFPVRGGRVELRPANEDFATQVYPQSQLHVQGRVIALLRQY